MPDARFLLVRLGSFGDVIHALPAASALRDTFPEARIDWLIEPKWRRLLEGNPDLTEIIPLEKKTAGGLVTTIRKLRAVHYTCAIDFQGLYKSALPAFASGAPRRIGFPSTYAREGIASIFYTDKINPRGPHKVDHNLTLAQAAGARPAPPRFPLTLRPEDEKQVTQELARHNILVNSVAPGWVATDMSNPVLETKAGQKMAAAAIPIGRPATAEEIAGPILFLASDLANFITGEIINVNGGSVLCG